MGLFTPNKTTTEFTRLLDEFNANNPKATFADRQQFIKGARTQAQETVKTYSAAESKAAADKAKAGKTAAFESKKAEQRKQNEAAVAAEKDRIAKERTIQRALAAPPKQVQKTGKTIKLPNGQVANITGSAPLTDPEWAKGVDLNKLGSIVYTDKGSFVSYSKDFLDGKGNVIDREGGKTVFNPSYLTKNANSSFTGEGEFSGSVLVPYTGGSVLGKKDNIAGSDKNSDYIDSPLLGKTIQMPDGSYQTVTALTAPTGASSRYGVKFSDGFSYINTADGGNFVYYDEAFLNGERRGGNDRHNWRFDSQLLRDNIGNAKQVDFSGVGDSIGNGLKSKGVIIPNIPDENGKYRPPGEVMEYWAGKKGGIFGGGFIGETIGDIGKILNDPIIQAGISAFVPGGAAIVAGYNTGNALANGGVTEAIKAGLVGVAAGAAGGFASSSLGSLTGNAVVDSVLKGGLQGSTEGLVGSVLTGGDLKQGIVSGLIGGSAGGLANSVVGSVFNDPTRIDGTDEVETPAEVSGGSGVDRPNTVGDLNLGTNQLIGDRNISPIGINSGAFKPTVTDPLNPDFNNFGGTFDSDVGLKLPEVPKLGGDNGIGITIPLFNSEGQLGGFQGVGGSVTPDFNIPLGDPNSFVNNPTITGKPLVSGGNVTPVPDFNTGLADLGSGNVGTGLAGGAQTGNTTPVPVDTVKTGGIEKFIESRLKGILTGLLTQQGNNLLGGGNPLTQSPSSGNNTGANMADYTGLIGNILGQNTQINRLEDTGTQIAGQYNQAAADLNKPFTPYNISTTAGTTSVNGQNINQTLSQPQQALANVAGQAAGMFGDVNIPNADNIRNTALQGSQNLLQQAQGFNPQSAAQQEFEALQQLYAPQRERDRMALENRLRAQGRLGASDNPALRQLEESFRQQDLQGSIQSRDLAFQRQKALQDLSQGMFTQGSQAAQLPTQIQQQRAQIGNMGAQASQLPFQTATNQQQAANQLAATQSSQGTALANIIANLRDKGMGTQAGLMSQAAALKNARDVAALQGLFGGGGMGGIKGIGGAANTGINNLIGSGVDALTGLVKSGVNNIGSYFGGTTMPFINPANNGLTADQLNAMNDDDFISFLLNGGATYGTSEGE
jgi:hypothetical protein